MKIKSLLRLTTVAMTVTFAVLIALFIVRHSRLQREYLFSQFEFLTQRQAGRFDAWIASASRDLEKIRGYSRILSEETLPRETRFRYFADLMSQTIRYDSNEFNCYAAFEPDRARKYWGTDGLSFDLSKRYELIGTPGFNDPATFELSPDTRSFYQTDESQIWYHYAKRSAGIEITPIYFDSEYTKQWLITLSLGLYEDGKFQGMVGMDLLLDKLFQSVEVSAIGETGGQLIADTATGLVLTQVGERGSRKLEFVNISQRQEATLFAAAPEVERGTWLHVLQNDLSHVTLKGSRGRNYVVSSQKLGALPWTLITYQQESELRAPWMQGLLIYGILGAMALLAMIALSYAVSRKVTVPIQELASAMKQVTSNHVADPVVAPVQGTLETIQLGQYFNEMLKSIREYSSKLEASNRQLEELNADLEKRIEHRTEELRIARDLSEDANRAKSAFLANMSHELRTPLNAILGYAEMIKEDASDRELDAMVQDVEKIRAAGIHLLELINAILDLSKIEAGKMELFLETFSVERLVRDVASIINPLVRQQSNQFQIDSPEGIGSIHADLVKVRQILINLLSNACKFTRQGTVTLSVKSAQRDGKMGIAFSVSDTGIGMTADHMSRLFQVFTQADASTNRRYGGTGLGLALSRRFCQIMGGDITVQSDFGRGTTFDVWIPASVVAPRTVIPVRTSTPQAAGARTVLVIDDDPIVQDLLFRVLTREEFHVVAALSGEEGLKLAKEVKPDLITLDVMMPGMDGWEVLSLLKNDPELADIPVVMLTMIDNQSLGLALGVSDYLTKPVDRNRLIQVVKKYTEERPGTVMVVDDDASVRELMRMSLTLEGWEVMEADNGLSALSLLKTVSPGLILLDLMMPEMDGFQFVEELRKQESLRDIPVVVVTAKDFTSEDRIRLSGSVRAVMQKGAVSLEELLQRIRAIPM